MPASRVSQGRRQEAESVVGLLREAGFEALFAGGCVRDLLLGREPGDYDVATSASADSVQELFPRTVGVGAKFGVVKVLGSQGDTEVATFRRDGAYLDHRRPVEVRFSDAEGDASRRDFTINGMFLDPFTGEVQDYVGGREDLKAGRVRAIGDPDARFEEDRLRLLRAVRFAARFGFEIEGNTWQSIRKHAYTITEISWERIGEEIVKILGDGAAGLGFRLLSESGLLEAVLPEVARMRGVDQSPEHHPEGDVFVHTLSCLEKLDGKRHDPGLCLAVLLHDVGKPDCATTSPEGRIRFHGHCERGAEMSATICRRMRRSRATADRVSWLVRNHLRHFEAQEMRTAKLKRFLAEPWIEALLELIRIDALSGSGDLSRWQYCVEQLALLEREEAPIDALLRGRDLIELGYSPGPSFKGMLESALDAQLEGQFDSSTGARRWVSERFPLD